MTKLWEFLIILEISLIMHRKLFLMFINMERESENPAFGLERARCSRRGGDVAKEQCQSKDFVLLGGLAAPYHSVVCCGFIEN